MNSSPLLSDEDIGQLTGLSRFLEEKNDIIARQADEIAGLRKELAELRCGIGIEVVIEGRHMRLNVLEPTRLEMLPPPEEEPASDPDGPGFLHVLEVHEEPIRPAARNGKRASASGVEDSFVL